MEIQVYKEDIDNMAIPENSFANDVFGLIRHNLCHKLGKSSIKLSKNDTFFAMYPTHPLANLFTKEDNPCINFQDIRLQDLLLDEGAMITPLRISTPSTKIRSASDEEYKQTNYFQQLKSQIKAQHELTKLEKKQILQLLDTLQVASQELFSQTMSEIYLNRVKALFQDCEHDWLTLSANWEKFNHLMKQHQLHQEDFSQKDVLMQRKAMDETAKLLFNTMKGMDNPNAAKAISSLYQSLSYAKQTNDLHFQYANKPSYFFSNAINQIEKWGGRVAVAASVIGIASVATALALPALGIAVPAFVGVTAAICTCVALAVGMPLALKKIGQSIYNGIRYNAAPTKGEIINAALTGTSMLAAGTTGLIGVSAFQGLGIATAAAAAAVKATNNMTKTALGLAGEKSKVQFNQFKQRFQQTKDSIQQAKAISNDTLDDEPTVIPNCRI